MRSKTCLLAIFVFSTASSALRAEDPKFAQLKTKSLFTAAAPDLKGGVVFSAGAFDLTGSPSAMIFANYGPQAGIRFVHVNITYKGEYTDPANNIAGYLYHLKDAGYDRYFLISKTGITGPNDSARHVIDFNTNGEHMSYFRGTFAPNP